MTYLTFCNEDDAIQLASQIRIGTSPNDVENLLSQHGLFLFYYLRSLILFY